MTRVDAARKRVLVAAFLYGQAMSRVGVGAERDVLDGSVAVYQEASRGFREAVRLEGENG